MKAAENVVLSRTVADTDPLLMKLELRQDEGIGYVPDDATVVMHVDVAPVKVLTGTARGDDEGYFSFATADIADLAAGNYRFEVQVTDGSVEYTVARGTIVNTAQIA